jgi:hypothetical protein
MLFISAKLRNLGIYSLREIAVWDNIIATEIKSLRDNAALIFILTPAPLQRRGERCDNHTWEFPVREYILVGNQIYTGIISRRE